MAKAPLRGEMEALMARLIQTEQALLDTRQQVVAALRAAPLVGLLSMRAADELESCKC